MVSVCVCVLLPHSLTLSNDTETFIVHIIQSQSMAYKPTSPPNHLTFNPFLGRFSPRSWWGFFPSLAVGLTCFFILCRVFTMWCRSIQIIPNCSVFFFVRCLFVCLLIVCPIILSSLWDFYPVSYSLNVLKFVIVITQCIMRTIYICSKLKLFIICIAVFFHWFKFVRNHSKK